jgi:uncharacterized protein YdeI (YjbR/CyaY-like superfamily)
MKIGETLYITDRKEWRTWLRKNHRKKKEIWLIYYKRHTGKARIPYDDAVEEALCFGWIDSTVKRIDDERYTQKYTPRNPKSIWSESNIKRANKMIKARKMTKIGRELFEHAIKTGQQSSRSKIVPKKLLVPADLKKALARNKKARENFSNFAPSYRKMYIFWILNAKRKETRARRIKRVVKLSAENKKSLML